MRAADGGGRARAMGGRHGVLDQPTCLLVRSSQPQGVGVAGPGPRRARGCRGRPWRAPRLVRWLGESAIPALAEVECGLSPRSASACSPRAGRVRGRRGRVPHGAGGSSRAPARPSRRPSPARSSSRAWPTASVASAPTSHRSAARASRSAASRGAPSFSARSAPCRSAANAAEPSPARSWCDARSPSRRSSSTPSVGDRLEVGGPGRVHRRRLAGQVGLGQHVGQQRVPEPDTLTAEHDDPGVDGLADRPGFGDAELRGDGRQRPQVGRAAGDGQDPGDLPRWGRQPSPGVQQRLAELVGQVVGQLGGVEVAAAYQQLAEVRVAPRPARTPAPPAVAPVAGRAARRSGRRWRPGRGGSAPAPRCRAAGGRCPASAGSGH